MWVKLAMWYVKAERLSGQHRAFVPQKEGLEVFQYRQFCAASTSTGSTVSDIS